MYLSEFLLHYAKSECLKFGLQMLKQKKTYLQMTLSLLKRHSNTEKCQKDFIKRCPDGIDDQFNRLVQEVRDIEAQLEKKRNRRTSLKVPHAGESNLNTSMLSNDSTKRKTAPMFISGHNLVGSASPDSPTRDSRRSLGSNNQHSSRLTMSPQKLDKTSLLQTSSSSHRL